MFVLCRTKVTQLTKIWLIKGPAGDAWQQSQDLCVCGLALAADMQDNTRRVAMTQLRVDPQAERRHQH